MYWISKCEIFHKTFIKLKSKQSASLHKLIFQDQDPKNLLIQAIKSNSHEKHDSMKHHRKVSQMIHQRSCQLPERNKKRFRKTAQ